MKVFLAGGTGAMGKQLVPMLVDAGHTVVATTRSPGRSRALATLGAEPVVMDGLNRDSVRRAVDEAQPEVVVHQLTALSGPFDLKHFEATFAETNRLRTAGTDNLLAAAQDAGVKRFIAASYGGWNNQRSGGPAKVESDPLDPSPLRPARKTLEAIQHVEQAVPSAPGITGLVLRYAGFYGPGTNLSRGGEMMELVRRRKMPVVGAGTGVWSFVHIKDAARATVQALDLGSPGIYNVADDEPAPISVWLPYLAEAIGAKPPRHLRVWLAKPMIGEMGISVMTDIRGSSNAKAKRELEWTLAYPSWRSGFRTGLG